MSYSEIIEFWRSKNIQTEADDDRLDLKPLQAFLKKQIEKTWKRSLEQAKGMPGNASKMRLKNYIYITEEYMVMKVMKKLGKSIIIVLLFLIMSLVFVGCGNGQADPTESSELESNIQSETNEIGTQDQTETQGTTENDETETVTQEESQTTETENPTETEEPTEPVEPTETEEPTEPVEPTETEQPTESEQPTETPDPTPDEPVEPQYTYTDMTKTMYAKSSVNVRDLPTSDGNKLGKLSEGEEVKVTGQCNETKWYRIEYDGKTGYVSNKYLTSEKPKEEEPSTGTEDNDGLPPGYSWEDRDGDGCADLPSSTPINGWNVRTIDISPEYAKFVRELSEAGMYVVKIFETNDGEIRHYVLAPTADDAFMFLWNYLAEQGLKGGNGSGGWWDSDMTVGFWYFKNVTQKK